MSLFIAAQAFTHVAGLCRGQGCRVRRVPRRRSRGHRHPVGRRDTGADAARGPE